MRSENDPLKLFDPFSSARNAIGTEMILSLRRHNSKVFGAFRSIFGLIEACRDTVSKINISASKVRIIWICSIRKLVTFQLKPVATVLWIGLSPLQEVPRFRNDVLAASAEDFISRNGDTYRLLWRICIKADMVLSYVHVALEQDALGQPAWIF